MQHLLHMIASTMHHFFVGVIGIGGLVVGGGLWLYDPIEILKNMIREYINRRVITLWENVIQPYFKGLAFGFVAFVLVWLGLSYLKKVQNTESGDAALAFLAILVILPLVLSTFARQDDSKKQLNQIAALD